MNFLRRDPVPRPLRGHVTQGGAGRVSRSLAWLVLVVVVAYLVVSVTLEPTKRNIQLVAGVVFLGLVLVAHPRKALLFTLVVLPFPAYTTAGSTSTLLILAVAALAMVKSRELELPSPFVHRPSDMALVGFVLCVLLSLYQVPSTDLQYALRKTIGLIAAVMLYYMVLYLVRTREELVAALKAALGIAAVLCVIAFLQYLFPTKTILPSFFAFSKRVATMEEVRGGTVRAFATFPGFELFAEYVVMALFLQYMVFRQERTLLGRAIWLGAMVFGLIALFTTATRAGVIILALGSLLLILRSGRAVPRPELLRVVFVALAVFYLTLPFFGDFYGFMLDRLAGLGEGSKDMSVVARMGVLQQAIDAIPESPLVGHGFFDKPGVFRGYVGMHIHNLYVTLAYKIGIPGTVLFLFFVGSIVHQGHRLLGARGVDPRTRAMLLFLNTVVVLFLIDQVKIEFVRDPLTMHTTFQFLAFAAAANRIARDEIRWGAAAPRS